jgi:hypothetical protein
MAEPTMRKVWDNYRVIGEVTKSDRTKFVVALGTRDGVKYINIREFYLKKKEQIWKPSLEGISIPLTYPIQEGTKILRPATGLMNLITMAVQQSPDFALADPEHEIWYTPKPKPKKTV